MVIVLVGNAFLAFLALILPALSVTLPAEFLPYFADFCSIMLSGWGFCKAFCHADYILSLLSIILLYDVAQHAYGFLIWIAKKMPFLHIS